MNENELQRLMFLHFKLER